MPGYTVNTPSLGPIVGHTDHQHSRLFLRGEGAPGDRLFAVVRCRVRGSTAWGAPVFNKLSPTFDLTGVCVLNQLAAATAYEVQAGWFSAPQLELAELGPTTQLDWGHAATASLRTCSATAAARSYVVGSCRYLLRLLGHNWFDDRGDKVFRSVREQVAAGRPIDALLMIGDQIYADDLGGLSPDDKLSEFLKRYRAAFGQEHLRALMASVPTYMLLDDHEIENDWPSKATAQDQLVLYPRAMHAYQIYQCSHSPLFNATPEGRIEGQLEKYWYEFSDGTADWFMLDTRTERRAGSGQMLGARQMQKLREWLLDGSGRIKFIVSGVPMFPDLGSEGADKWGGFPGQRKEILDLVFEHQIPRVVMLSGDVHCSFSCYLEREDKPGFVVHGVVASPFFWPYPHMARRDFLFDRELAQTGSNVYTTRALSACYFEDNFCRLDVGDDGSLRVAVHERKGALLGTPVRLF
ncbi:alkaline phosphatase D family protein [Pelomonas sp. SE-A7]|uniref:alkaline phosphatase D family protein n=1 Tax=Pelomonas sp. SE-A7 TaxID=3054953 RepID=UPI00259D144D|nr:alkaline phosphatase D family protein [Pelomonas sp. SE-A7]MDM4766255.1 alkaline phosphatase D family protein [Pelomonas sp. SE-A7]